MVGAKNKIFCNVGLQFAGKCISNTPSDCRSIACTLFVFSGSNFSWDFRVSWGVSKKSWLEESKRLSGRDWVSYLIEDWVFTTIYRLQKSAWKNACYINSQISVHKSRLLLNCLIKMSQYPSFCYNFAFLFVTYLSFSWFSFKIPYYKSRRNFFHGHWEAIYFFHSEERYKK